MRNNKYQSKAMHAGMFSTAGLDSGASSLQPYYHAGFKIVQRSFCGRFCVPRPIVLDLVMHLFHHSI